MKIRPRIVYTIPFLLLTALFALSAGGFTKESEAIARTEPSHACMASNRDTGRPQAFTEVEGKRYYGCSEACIANLGENAAFRYSIDPVSGRRVDKALAVLGAKPGGELLYFESEETFRAYRELSD